MCVYNIQRVYVHVLIQASSHTLYRQLSDNGATLYNIMVVVIPVSRSGLASINTAVSVSFERPNVFTSCMMCTCIASLLYAFTYMCTH